VAWTWRVKLSLSTERDLFTRLREDAEKVAIKVFADNLRDLLLAAPAGPRVVMGLDPGIRTGVKVAVVDATGKLVDTATVFPHEPRKDWEGSLHTLGKLCAKHGVNLIAIGNGTASRETDKLAADLIKLLAKMAEQAGAPEMQRKVVVSEAGASVYSASEFASQEMPDVDVSLRGAASIARRLQDPLAELVKIDPKSDRRRPVPARREPERTGAHAGGRGRGLRELGRRGPEHGQRAAAVARVGPVGQRGQGGGALARIQRRLQEPPAAAARERPRPQDLRAERGLPAHPRRREPAGHDRRAPRNLSAGRADHPGPDRQAGAELMGRADMLKTLKPELFANEKFGVITVKDILGELEKPGPRPAPRLQGGALQRRRGRHQGPGRGHDLEGTVSNVAQFGAFVDLGVHQDGLVHVSQLSHKFVTDAREVVKTGDIVKVKVLEVDVARKRISLSMKLDAAPARRDGPRDNRFEGAGRGQQQQGRRDNSPQPAGQMASAFAKLQGLRK
jgi:uncharacterized protein